MLPSPPAGQLFLGLGQLDRAVCGAGQVGQGPVRTPPLWELLTLPCISSRMVRVTLRPPSETLDSISYREQETCASWESSLAQAAPRRDHLGTQWGRLALTISSSGWDRPHRVAKKQLWTLASDEQPGQVPAAAVGL